MPYHIQTKGVRAPVRSAQDPSTHDDILRAVRTLASQLGRVPRSHEVEQRYSEALIKSLFGSFETLLLQANVLPQKFKAAQLPTLLQSLTTRLQRPATVADVDHDLALPAAVVYRHYFGGVTDKFTDVTPHNHLGAFLTQGGRGGHRVTRSQPKGSRNPHAVPWEQVRPVLDKALHQKWTSAQLEAALQAVDPATAAIFANLIHPPDQIQISKKDLAQQLGITINLHNDHEQHLLTLCTQMGWAVAPLSHASQIKANARSIGRARWNAIDALIAQTKANRWSRAEFETKLLATDPKVYRTFINITNPPNGIRLSQCAMATTLQIASSSNTVGTWELALEDLCDDMGWPIIAPSDTIKQRTVATIEGKEVWEKIADIVKQAKALEWSPAALDTAIYNVSEKMAIVLRNLIRPNAERLTQQSLAETLTIHLTTIVLWEERLKTIFRFLGWVVPEPHKTDWRPLVGPGATSYAMMLVREALHDISVTDAELRACLHGDGDLALQHAMMDRLVATGRPDIVDTLRRSGDMTADLANAIYGRLFERSTGAFRALLKDSRR